MLPAGSVTYTFVGMSEFRNGRAAAGDLQLQAARNYTEHSRFLIHAATKYMLGRRLQCPSPCLITPSSLANRKLIPTT